MTTQPTPPTASELREIMERAEKATPGPWDRLTSNTIRAIKGDLAVPLFDARTPYDWYRKVYTTERVMCDANAAEVNNAEFVAHARTDIPALLALCESQAQEIARLKQELHNTVIADGQICDRLNAALARKDAALKPFADLAPHFTPGHGTRPSQDDHIVMELASGNLPQASITVGDLRAAAAAHGVKG